MCLPYKEKSSLFLPSLVEKIVPFSLRAQCHPESVSNDQISGKKTRYLNQRHENLGADKFALLFQVEARTLFGENCVGRIRLA